MKAALTYLLLLLSSLILAAQQRKDSVLTLPAVTKEARSNDVDDINPVIGYKYSASKNLNEVLRESAGVYLRNYGNSQLSSLTLRGTGAAQTDLLWNGIKLNSPALGQVDASLFNLGMSDGIELSGSSRYGNVGGFVNMQNETKVDSGFSLNANVTYGSFNTLRTFGKANYGNGRFSGSSRISYLSCDNNYRFINSYKAENPKEVLSNAKVQLLSFMQQFNARINRDNSIHFSLWLTDAQREIPPIISKPESKESQDDYSLRSSLMWKGSFRQLNTEFTSAFLRDVIHYRNPEIYLDERSIMEAVRNNLIITYGGFKRLSVSAELGYDHERAKVVSYGIVRTRNIEKLVVGVKYLPVNAVVLQLSIRECIYDKRFSPLSPMASISYRNAVAFDHTLAFQANASRSFRFPTLNDMYWVPGGNPKLKTEKGWDGQAGASYSYSSYFSFKVDGFCKYIANWIQWIPNGSYWEPQNVKRVLTRGVEVSAKVEAPFSSSGFTLKANLNYSYTRATNLDALSAFDQSKNKQLIYVPLHVANLSVHLEYKKFYLRAISTFTDAVFTTSDNSQSLMGYYLLDLEAGKDFVVKNCEVGASFRVNNVTDKSYQNVAQRPMPGRSFEGTLRFKFNS